MLLPPYVRHYGLQHDEHEAYFAHFQAEGAETPPPTELDNGHILLPLWGQVPLELPCFDLMEYAACHRAPPFFSENFLSSQIQAILYQLSLAMQKKRLWPKRENRTALQILQYIDNNKGRQLQNQDYAAAFGMTYRRLNAIFQAVYGVTIKQMQGILRVEQAKRMLSSGYTILETSAACGHNLCRAQRLAQPRLHSPSWMYRDGGHGFGAQGRAQIIPEIIGVALDKRPADAQPYEMPKFCPVCGAPVFEDEEEAAIRCTGAACPASCCAT